MGIFDWDEEVEDVFEEDYEEVEENKYLASADEAIKLVAKILAITKVDYAEKRNIQKLDHLMDVDFLGSLKKMQLNNEAQLQLRLSQLSDKLLEEKKYQILRGKSLIGIGGKFSAGKSRFINSLLNVEELLPEDQNPTTSIPTYIVAGDQERVDAYTIDNEQVPLDVMSMQALTHKFYEKYQMGFSAFINSLIITEPDMPYKKLVFLDTPGYSKADMVSRVSLKNDLSDANKSYEQLKSVDFLIWLVDIENGVISETDIAFISRLDIETPILVVVNKADKKIDSEIEAVVNQIEITLNENSIKYFGVAAYSSRTGKEWGNRGIIKAFLEMTGRKRKKKEDILVQMEEIKKQVSIEIENKIRSSTEERNKLNDIIFRSDDIKEIKTLIDIYSETMEEIRDMKECKRQYTKRMRQLEVSLNKHFERKQ